MADTEFCRYVFPRAMQLPSGLRVERLSTSLSGGARLIGARFGRPCALALLAIFILTSHRAVAATDPGLIISEPGIYDGQGRAIGYLRVDTDDALVSNYSVTGYGPAISCVTFSGNNITIRNVTVQNCGHTGVVFESGTNNVLEDSFIADPITQPGVDSWGIYQDGNAGHITVRRVTVHGSGFSVYAPNGSSLIEDNDFLIPDSYRTDCQGNRQSGGPCSCGEFGIATKTGRNVIRGNRISGYRQSDPVCGGSGSVGIGIELAACATNSQVCPSEYDVVENNVIADSTYGIFLPPQASRYTINSNFVCFTDAAIGDGYSQTNSSITNNIFYGNSRDLDQYGTASAVTYGNYRLNIGNCPPVAGSTPASFAFTDVTKVALGTLQTSTPVTITGINTAVPISVAGGEYSIGCGAEFTTEAGTISNNQTVCVRHTSAATYAAFTNTTLIVGPFADTFTTVTISANGGDSGGGGGALDVFTLLGLSLTGWMRRRLTS